MWDLNMNIRILYCYHMFQKCNLWCCISQWFPHHNLKLSFGKSVNISLCVRSIGQVVFAVWDGTSLNSLHLLCLFHTAAHLVQIILICLNYLNYFNCLNNLHHSFVCFHTAAAAHLGSCSQTDQIFQSVELELVT